MVVTPAVAPVDNQKPTDRASSGSTSSSPITAMHSSRAGWRSRPSTKAVADSTAIAPARMIDGSNRVSITNQPINGHRDRPAHRTAAAAAATDSRPPGHNATFWPDTAVRCDSPLARKRSTIAGGCSASSPSTRPRNRAASASGQRPRAAGKDVADTIRRAIERPTGGDLGHPCQRDLADDVLRGDALSTTRIERIANSTDEHPIARRPRRHSFALGAASCPVLETFASHLDHRSRRHRQRLRVADDRDPSLEVTRVTRLPIRPRPTVARTCAAPTSRTITITSRGGHGSRRIATSTVTNPTDDGSDRRR